MSCRFSIASLFFILLSLVVGVTVKAEINPLQYKVWNYEVPNADFTKKADFCQYIPLDLKPTSDQAVVLNQIADKSIQTWLNSPSVRQSSIGGAAATVQDSMKADVTLSAPKSKVQHKFSFEYMLAQTAAQMKYSGWLNAVYRYEGASNYSNLELTEKILNNKDLFVTQSVTSIETKSSLGIKWSW